MTSSPDDPPDGDLQDDFDVHLPPAPYPGLRPFQKDEWPVFFGRETMSDDVIARLIEQRFVVVHGDSGCGKSSLLRAGVLARLEQENARGGLTWRTCAAEPGDAPLLNLARSLAQLDGRSDDEARIIEIRRVLNFGKDAPAALASLLLRGDSDHVCILLDQFEELFAFAKSHGKDEPGLLVQLLVGLLEKPPRGLYAVVTMRSEFLGACAQFDRFAETVNRTQYLLPRMVHADLMRAVRDPATLYGGQVAPELAERLILDAGSGQDELPLIQHGLMLLHRRKTMGAPEDESWRLELADYRVHVSQLLSDHADTLCEKAGAGHGPVIERIFRALTDINADGQAIRRKQSVADLVRLTETDLPTLEKILLPFRVDGASLLRPYGTGPLTLKMRVDISHEALIRCWRRIADPDTGWLRREFQDGLIWQSLRVQAQSFKQNRSNVLSPATARDRAAWMAERNEPWSERYKNEWPLVQELVRDSVEAARKSLAAERKRRQALTVSISLAAILFAALSIGLWVALQRANQATAAALWSRLDFVQGDLTEDELNALWEIQQTDSGIRKAFIAQMHKDPAKLGIRAAPVFRAVYLKWPADVAEDTWDAVLQALTQSPDRAFALVPVAQSTPGRLTSAQVQRLLDLSQKALTDTRASASHAQMIAAVAPRLHPDSVPQAVNTLLSALTTSEVGTIKPVSQALEAMPATLTTEQTSTTLASLLTLLAGTSDEDDANTIGYAASVVAGKSGPGDAQSFAPLLTSLDTMTGRGQLAALVPAIRAVRDRLPADQARTVLAKQVKALAAAKDPERLLTAASVIDALPGTLADDQARASASALTKLLQGRASDQYVFPATCFAIQALAPHMTATQADALRAPLVTLLRTATESSRLGLIASTLRTLPGSLPPDQVRIIQAQILAALAKTVDSYEMRELASALVSLPAPLSADQAEMLIGFLRRATDDDQVHALASAIQAIGPTLAPAPAQSALATLVTALSLTSESEALAAVALAIRKVPGTLTLGDAQPALARLFEMLLGTRPFLANYQMEAISVAIQALTSKLAVADVPSALEPLMAAFATTTDAGQLSAILVTLTAGADALRPGQLAAIRPRAAALLAWSPSPFLSAAAARALSAPAIRRRATPAEEVKAIVDVLRYPEAAGAPTEALLGALRSLAPPALGNDATLDEILNWIARDHPEALAAEPSKPDRPRIDVRREAKQIL